MQTIFSRVAAAGLSGAILMASPACAVRGFHGDANLVHKTPPFDVTPASEALHRLIPGHFRQVRLRAIESRKDEFRVLDEAGTLTIEGTSPAVLLTGFNAYLKQVAKADISWVGEQLDLPDQLPVPEQEISGAANVPHRFALNDTDDGYTGPYRTWDDWEREIDVLALHGINEVFVPIGTERVYYETLRGFGYSDKEARRWIPTPAYQPWWLLQNLSGLGGPISTSLLERRTDLGQRIVRRLRELGVTPVLPGYFGSVPTDFAKKNAGARVVPQGTWLNFERPGWLDPRDAVFPKVAAAFYDSQRRLFGDTAMYKMDVLHEGGRAGDVPVGAAARRIEASLRKAHPDAVWALLGWHDNPRRKLLDAVDRSRLLILDGVPDRYPDIVDRERDWRRTPYAFGSIWNFGGRTTFGANMPTWTDLYPRWRDKKGSALSGIAMLPEASDNNPAALELFTELAWTEGRIDLKSWFRAFAEGRYGLRDPKAEKAWDLLRRTAYGTRRDGASYPQDGLFAARPSLAAVRASSWGPIRMRYDAGLFQRSLAALLDVAPELRDSSAYRSDLVDVARQALSNETRRMLPRIRKAYRADRKKRFNRLTRTWLRRMTLMDRLVATDERHLLGRWIAAARSQGGDQSERDLLEWAARSLVTKWGMTPSARGGPHEYANREWAGLLGYFYRDRWDRYFRGLRTAMAKDRRPRKINWDRIGDAWTKERKRYITEPRGDPHRMAQTVLNELRMGDARAR